MLHPAANSHGRQRQGATEVVSENLKWDMPQFWQIFLLTLLISKKHQRRFDYFFLWLIFQLKTRILLLDYFWLMVLQGIARSDLKMFGRLSYHLWKIWVGCDLCFAGVNSGCRLWGFSSQWETSLHYKKCKCNHPALPLPSNTIKVAFRDWCTRKKKKKKKR